MILAQPYQCTLSSKDISQLKKDANDFGNVHVVKDLEEVEI